MKLKGVHRTLFFRLTVAFISTVMVLAVLQGIVLYRYFVDYAQETVQRTQLQLATELAKRFDPHLRPAPDSERLTYLLYELSESYPTIDVYLIDTQGKIRASLLALSDFFGAQAIVQIPNTFAHLVEQAG